MRKDFVSSVSNKLDIPAEAMSSTPLIQLRGKNSLCVENHGGILEYSDTAVKIAVKGGCVTARGSGIFICRMTKKCLEIHGRIVGLELE